MSLIELFAVAVGLSMDACAVSISKGLVASPVRMRHCLATGLCFGLFQAGMPLAGYVLGDRFASEITLIDHWIAFLLLSVIGVRMLIDARGGGDAVDDSFTFRSLLPLAIATSIDALAVGVGFAFLKIRILPAVSLIGAVTFTLSALGVKLGSAAGIRFRAAAEAFGGFILLLMGVKILLEHL